MPTANRRLRRSEDRETALTYQLEHVQNRGRLEALVLADDDGIPLASSGDGEVCAELAAVAPLLGRAPAGLRLPYLLSDADLGVRPVTVLGQRLHVASIGGGVSRDALLAHSGRGVARILES